MIELKPLKIIMQQRFVRCTDSVRRLLLSYINHFIEFGNSFSVVSSQRDVKTLVQRLTACTLIDDIFHLRFSNDERMVDISSSRSNELYGGALVPNVVDFTNMLE